MPITVLVIELKILFSVCTTSMDWWIPHFAYMKHNASNQTISLKGIPTVPDLFHAPASVKIESSHEGRSSPALIGDGVPKNRKEIIEKVNIHR